MTFFKTFENFSVCESKDSSKKYAIYFAVLMDTQHQDDDVVWEGIVVERTHKKAEKFLRKQLDERYGEYNSNRYFGLILNTELFKNQKELEKHVLENPKDEFVREVNDNIQIGFYNSTDMDKVVSGKVRPIRPKNEWPMNWVRVGGDFL